MGDISSDTSAEFGMLIRAYLELQKVSPNHELLGVVRLHDDSEGMDFHPQYFDRFTKLDDEHNIHGYARYRIALEQARGEVLIASGHPEPRAYRRPSELENI